MKENKKMAFSGADFTTGPIMPSLITFFIPFLFSFLLNTLYNTVDAIIIGQFVGASGLVSVSMGGKMLSLFTIVGTAMATGGQILISHLFGAKKHKEVSETIGTLLSSLMVCAIILAIILIALSSPVLHWLKTPDESFADARAYLIITSCGLPFIFGYNAVSAILRGKGDSKNPLKFIAIASVVNVIGDLVFIMAFNLGAVGTAIATVLGQAVSLICSLIEMYKNRESLGFDFKVKSFAIRKDKLKDIAKLGSPLALRSFFIMITLIYLARFVNMFGLTEAAAYAVGEKILGLFNVFAFASNHVAAGMIGQNYGAKNYARIGKVIRCDILLTLACSILICAICLIFPRGIFGLFTKDSAVLDYAMPFMLCAVPNLIIAAIQDPFDGFVSGIGKTVFSMVGGILDGVVLRLTFTFLLAYTLNMGLTGFFLANAISRLGPLIIDLLVFFFVKWKKAAV